MKKKIVAVLLSLSMSVVMLAPVNASDFMDDMDLMESQIEEVQPEDTVQLPDVQEELVILPEQAFEEELPLDEVPSITEEETVKVDETGSEESGDFVDEIDMSELLGNQDAKADEDAEEAEENDFAELPAEADLTEGWEERSVDDTVKYMYAKGSQDENGNAEYYTSEDGIVTIDEKQYFFDQDGYMTTGRVEYNGKYIFLMPEEKAVLNAGAVGTPNPMNSNLGQQQKAYWNWTGKAFEYYASSGYFNSIADLNATKMKKGTYVGYFKIDGYYFSLKDDGVPRTGDYEIKEGTRPGLYYFYSKKNEKGYPGVMAVGTWVRVKNSKGTRWRYYDKSGRTTLGIKAKKLDKNIDPACGDNTYLLTEGGYIFTKTALRKAADGYTYYCNAKGIVQKSKIIKTQNVRYYVSSNGRVASWTNSWHWIKSAGNRPYYFGSTPGKIVEKKGWLKITSGNSTKWYCFGSNGNSTLPGWKNGYYFDSKCALVTGMKTIDGKTYYFEPSSGENHNGKVYKNKAFTYNGKIYYAGSDGALYKSKWATISGNSYYFQADGTMALNVFAKKGDSYGYLDSTGKFTTGWVIANASANQIRYINTQAAGYVINDYRIVNGVRYYFDANGYRVSDLTSFYPPNWKNDPVLVKLHNGGYAPYYLECDKTNGVITVYTDSTKSIPVKSIRTSVGNPTTLTPSGTFTLTRSSRWQPLMGPSWGQYGTHVVNGIFIHSVACTNANSYNVPAYEYDRLGSPASHGCLRVCVADAKWVYDNCSGGRITIFYGGAQSQECFKGPLGRKPLVPRRGAGNFDPTDPAV